MTPEMARGAGNAPAPRPAAKVTRLAKIARRPQFWFGACFLVPTMVWYAFFVYFPIARGLWLSVVDYDFLSRTSRGFVGLANFHQLLLNPLFFVSLRNTFVLASLQFVSILTLGLLVAACLTNVKQGDNLYQALIFLPVVVSLVAVSLLFLMLMDPQVGAFNKVLRSLGLPPSQWLSSLSSALPTLAAIDVWKGLGLYVMLLAAGMRNVPSAIHDAAQVDGANEWQRFWMITLPLLAPVLVLVTILLAISSLQEYTSVAVLTNGGPGNATYVLNLLIVQEAFADMRFGVAAAAAVVEFALVLLISIGQLRLFRSSWSY